MQYWMKWGIIPGMWKENRFAFSYRWTTSSGGCAGNRLDGARVEQGDRVGSHCNNPGERWCWFESSEKWSDSGSIVSREATRFAQEAECDVWSKQIAPGWLWGLARATRRLHSSWHSLTWEVQFGGKTKCSQLGHIQWRCLLDILGWVVSRRQLWTSEVPGRVYTGDLG